MPAVLLCGKVSRDLQRTVVWNADVERRSVGTRDEALATAAAGRFDLVIVDSTLPDAARLVRDLRIGAATRSVSIAVVMARREFEPGDLELIDAGANAILRPPASTEWNQRLGVLMRVPPRKAGRFPIELRVDAVADSLPLTLAGTVLNLSEQGLLVETDVPLPLGADVDFRIHLRDAPQPLRGCGQVVRQDSPRRGGIRFYALEQHGLARVRRFVRH